jgi:hypothetical protein
MHGLIFKIKESHRQDQSESFVNIYIFSQQVKWNHFIMTSVYMIFVHIFVVSSSRNKTNPYHRNKFIPVLNATLLQAFKPKPSTYDQLLKSDQQEFICIRWNIFNRIHIFAICDVFLNCSFWCDISIWWFEKLPKQLRQTFFSSYTISITLLTNYIKIVVLAEQSLHHNIILEKLDHCWVNGICTKKVISYSPTLSLNHI